MKNIFFFNLDVFERVICQNSYQQDLKSLLSERTAFFRESHCLLKYVQLAPSPTCSGVEMTMNGEKYCPPYNKNSAV